MSVRCHKCFRPLSRCLCSQVTPQIECGIKFVFLMHPKEAKRNRTGTGRLAHITLADSEILVGLDFEKNDRLTALLADEKYLPLVLYPGEASVTARELAGQRQALPAQAAQAWVEKTPLVLVLDATWFCARKLIEHNGFLLSLPRLSFAGSYRSLYTFKREPRPECISTIEACYYLIKEMQETGLVANDADAEPLMCVFKEMVRQQLQAENDRIAGLLPDTHSYNWKYRQKREIPAELQEPVNGQ